MTESDSQNDAIRLRAYAVAAVTTVIGGPGQDLWIGPHTAEEIADAVIYALIAAGRPQEKP